MFFSIILSFLNRLTINELRNLQSVSVSLSPSLNIFYGNNGSGKTSILEAVSLLGLGKSFRSHKSRSLIHYDKNELTVFAEIIGANGDQQTPVGIQKSRNGKTAIRMSGSPVYSAAALAKQLPLQIINANSFQLIEGAPVQRRQFLDWMVFHVKPEFSEMWKGLQKALKQRNSLLRHDKISYSDLRPWDVEFSRLALEIDKLREEVFQHFLEKFSLLYKELNYQELDITLEYLCGWNKELTFSDALTESFDRDSRDGYSHIGPHRSDLKIKANGKTAADILSRGQEKALISAMHIVRAQIYKEITGKMCLFLIDDIQAELDQLHSQQLARWLTDLNAQILVTGVSQEGLSNIWEKEDVKKSVFHVEHGHVTELVE